MTEVKIRDNSDFVTTDSITKVTTMGNVVELTVCSRQSSGSPCRKVDKDHYIDRRTGELFTYSHSDSRGDNLHGIRQTLSRIRALVNTNVTEPANCLWVTFTYRQDDGIPMTDSCKLYTDFKCFWKRFLYYCNSHGYGKPEYISVIEPQGSGAWHAHCFFIWSDEAPFIPNSDMAYLWRQGFTRTQRPRDCDNIGAYFSAYLADIPVDDVCNKSVSGDVLIKSFTDDQGLIKQKKFIKGGRLYFYPPGMNIVRTSRGIKNPDVEYMSHFEAKEKISAATETFSRAYDIVDDSGKVIQSISKQYYNTKRVKSQE